MEISKQNLGGLYIKLAAIIVGMPLAVLAVYAWLFPALHIKSPYGVIIGTLIAAGLSFYYIKQAKDITLAFIGAFVIAVIVPFLCFFLIANILGE
jgi:hypothetical protein